MTGNGLRERGGSVPAKGGVAELGEALAGAVQSDPGNLIAEDQINNVMCLRTLAYP